MGWKNLVNADQQRQAVKPKAKRAWPKKEEPEAQIPEAPYQPDPDNPILAPPGVPPFYDHQKETVIFCRANPRVFDMSDAGTGKTRGHLQAWAERRHNGGGRLLVFCPRTTMYAAWVADLHKFFPGQFLAKIAPAVGRQQQFDSEYDMIVTNLDAVKWVVDRPRKWFNELNIDTVIFDESEAFKHRTSARSKAAKKIAFAVPYAALLSGTPYTKSITELWHQVYMLDHGERLGSNFFKFRDSVSTPIQRGPRPEHREWVDKEGAIEAVSGMIADMTIRHEFENCLDIPKQVIRTVPFELTEEHKAKYDELANLAVLELRRNTVQAVNEAVLTNKLLQLLSGSVYGDTGSALIDSSRYELVMEMVMERAHPSVVFFLWRHQRDELIKLAIKNGVSHEYIDGTVSDKRRKGIIESYQKGDLQVVFLQPKSAAHSVTLTAGRTTIWASPIYEPNIFKQGNHRQYRAGQDKRTEVILLKAKDTIEEHVCGVLEKRREQMTKLLKMLTTEPD